MVLRLFERANNGDIEYLEMVALLRVITFSKNKNCKAIFDLIYDRNVYLAEDISHNLAQGSHKFHCLIACQQDCDYDGGTFRQGRYVNLWIGILMILTTITIIGLARDRILEHTWPWGVAAYAMCIWRD